MPARARSVRICFADKSRTRGRASASNSRIVCFVIAPERCRAAAGSCTSLSLRLRFLTKLRQLPGFQLPPQRAGIQLQQRACKLFERNPLPVVDVVAPVLLEPKQNEPAISE